MEIMSNAELSALFSEMNQHLVAIRNALLEHASSDSIKAYFTREEAAEYLRMSTRNLDELSRMGDIRRAKLGTGKSGGVRFRRIDLDAFVERQLEMDKSAARTHAKCYGPQT